MSLVIDLRGRTAVVTGASRGIGRAIALRLAECGADVLLTSRKQEDLERVAREAEAASVPGRVAAFAANAGDPDQAAAAIDFAMDTFGSIDLLVNNAATNPFFGDLVDLDPARARKTVEVNQYGPLAWIGNAWRAWMSEHGGAVVNIASIGAYGVEPGIGFYNATKAANVYLVRQLAWELAPRVRVNGIAPGLVRTHLSRALWENREQQFLDHIPLQRFGEPEDVADATAFLLSDSASWITGQVLSVDGGSLAAPPSGIDD